MSVLNLPQYTILGRKLPLDYDSDLMAIVNSFEALEYSTQIPTAFEKLLDSKNVTVCINKNVWTIFMVRYIYDMANDTVDKKFPFKLTRDNRPMAPNIVFDISNSNPRDALLVIPPWGDVRRVLLNE